VERIEAGTPTLVREWRIGDHIVEGLERTGLPEFWIGESVTLHNQSCGVIVQNHVHVGQRTRGGVLFLPIERDLGAGFLAVPPNRIFSALARRKNLGSSLADSVGERSIDPSPHSGCLSHKHRSSFSELQARRSEFHLRKKSLNACIGDLSPPENESKLPAGLILPELTQHFPYSNEQREFETDAVRAIHS
jgi:hypothetical protein